MGRGWVRRRSPGCHPPPPPPIDGKPWPGMRGPLHARPSPPRPSAAAGGKDFAHTTSVTLRGLTYFTALERLWRTDPLRRTLHCCINPWVAGYHCLFLGDEAFVLHLDPCGVRAHEYVIRFTAVLDLPHGPPADAAAPAALAPGFEYRVDRRTLGSRVLFFALGARLFAITHAGAGRVPAMWECVRPAPVPDPPEPGESTPSPVPNCKAVEGCAPVAGLRCQWKEVPGGAVAVPAPVAALLDWDSGRDAPVAADLGAEIVFSLENGFYGFDGTNWRSVSELQPQGYGRRALFPKASVCLVPTA